MKIIHLIPLASLIVIMTACSQHKKQESEHKEHHGTQKHHKEHKKHHSKTANDYMHQSSTEDLIKRFESPERDAYQKPEQVLEYLGNIENKSIMDIGAGSGYFSVKLANRGAKVIAADVSDEFQNVIKDRIADNNLENIELRKIPYDSPDLKKEEVDMVLIVNTYHHIENRSDYFNKVKAGIKAGGELIIIDFFKRETPVGPPIDHKIAKDVVIAELKEAGFENFTIDTELLPYQYIIKAK